MANRLSREPSLYLKQHAENPVDWFPWGEEAFSLAKTAHKPILLSIGYSACHWCHVMAHESFESETTAELMNELFVNIKIDREERPDLDHIFQTTAQVMGVSGGWPLTVFLTPEGKPFYVGTYFPPEDRYQRPGFPRLLKFISDTYTQQLEKVTETGQQLTDAVRAVMSSRIQDQSKENKEFVWDWKKLNEMLLSDFDGEHGGFGNAPKFPHSMNYEVLYRTAADFSLPNLGLRKMAQGGIYDHVGGGFHRYSTDRYWLVPHFEKMLYDNALLPRAYLDALHAGKADVQFVNVVRDSLDYVATEMTASDGRFYATQDADSEGEEGKFFVWSQDEFAAFVESSQLETWTKYLGVTAEGNFEHKNILHLAAGWLPPELQKDWATLKKRLYATRSKRVAPGRDEKSMLAWNGMMMRTFVQAALSLKEPRYLQIARKAFTAVTSREQKGVLPSVIYPDQCRFPAMLDDLAQMTDAALWLYRATGEMDYFESARRWAEQAIHDYWLEDQKLFSLSPRAAADLLVPPVQIYDGATPSANGTLFSALIVLDKLTGRLDFRRCVKAMEETMRPWCTRMPSAYSTWLLGFWLLESGPNVCQVIPGKELTYDFDLACQLYKKTALHPVTVLVASDTESFSLFDLQYRKQWEHHQGQSGFLLCGPQGCQPLRKNLDELL